MPKNNETFAVNVYLHYPEYFQQCLNPDIGCCYNEQTSDVLSKSEVSEPD